MHLELGLEFGSTPGSMTPYAIPSEYLLSRREYRILMNPTPTYVTKISR